jgi:MacB-like periplasmic core domain
MGQQVIGGLTLLSSPPSVRYCPCLLCRQRRNCNRYVHYPVRQKAGTPVPRKGFDSDGAVFRRAGRPSAQGRTFANDEDQPGHAPVALISQRLWERRYGRKADIIGRTAELNGRAFTVIGVMPASFRFQDWCADRLPRSAGPASPAGAIAHRSEVPAKRAIGRVPGTGAFAGERSRGCRICRPVDQHTSRPVAFTDGFEITCCTGKEGGPLAPVPWVSDGYFWTLGIPILRGRVFDARDRIDSPGVVVIRDALARRYFSGENPVGQRLKHGGPALNNAYKEIIGVVADVKYLGSASEDVPVYYEAAEQSSSRPMWLVLRTRDPARQWLSAVQAEIRTIDPGVPVADAASMAEAMHESLALPRFRSMLMAIFAAAALVLAAVGIYGVLV